MKTQVLVVDDSLTVRVDLQDAFESAGIQATLCSTAAAAREALSKNKFRLIILDVVLPDEDGTEFLKEIKASPATEDVPVMILSSESAVRDRIRGLSVGAVEYIGKPYDRSYVVARAGELLPEAEPAASATSILVIDDSPTSREILKAALVSAGYGVYFSETGEEGLRMAARLRPAAMLIDGNLPGINGATVVRRLRSDAVLRSTPCILITASDNPNDEFVALEAGSDTYVRKDEHMNVLLARLAAILRSSKGVSSASGEKSLLGTKRILAVDDSVTYLTALAEQLKMDGYEVIQASSGEQALELLSVQSVDCILLDLTMPGMSGQETCSQLKKSPRWRAIPLLMLTASEDSEAMLNSFSVGADDYIPKSSQFEVLKARLRAQLRRRQFEDENRRIREELVRKEVEAVEGRANRELAEARGKLLHELECANKELESFSYSVSHDLRAPLRGIDGFSKLLLDEYKDKLDGQAKDYLKRVRAGSQRMGHLIDDLLKLSQLSRHELKTAAVDITALAREVEAQLRAAQPERQVTFMIPSDWVVQGDAGLLKIALENLLGNAWKYSAKKPHAQIEFGRKDEKGTPAYFIRDNGSGFDMNYVGKLFTPFQRLHSAEQFEGTGIGLATVKRIIQRHGGEIWAESAVDSGSTFFTLSGGGRA